MPAEVSFNASTISSIALEQKEKQTVQSPTSPETNLVGTPQDKKKRPHPTNSTPTNGPIKVPRNNTDFSPSSLQTPGQKIDIVSHPVTPSKSYATRKNAGDITLEMRAKIEVPTDSPGKEINGMSRQPCHINVFGEPGSPAPESDSSHESVGVASHYRHMYTTVMDRAASLQRSFDHMEQELLAHAGKEHSSRRSPVGVRSQDPVVCFGRVCCDTLGEGKINKTSILLEGGRMEGGQRIELKLQDLSSFALFPGQWVLVEGINSSGPRMVVKRLMTGVPRPLPQAQITKKRTSPLRLVVASGPFCCTNNLDYAPLKDLLLNANSADVLILSGPFVDVAHPQLKSGVVLMAGDTDDGATCEMESLDYCNLFNLKVTQALEDMQDAHPSSTLQIVMVPSLADAFHDCVYPQPPLTDQSRKGVKSPWFPEEKYFDVEIPFAAQTEVTGKRMHLVSNPAMLRINEVVVGISSTDILMSMGRAEIAENPKNKQRLPRLAEHLVNQQSFFPLFPANGGVKANEDVPLDLSQSERWRMPVSPDILILPSKLATFASTLSNGTLALNPGQVARGSGGGTYANLVIHPQPNQARGVKPESGEEERCQVSDLVAVQIKRV